MTDFQVLEAYRAATLEISAIREQMQRLDLTGQPMGLAGQSLDNQRHTNHRTAAAMQTLDGLEAALCDRLQALSQIIARFEAIIASAAPPIAATVLRRYYGLGETDAQVGSALGYSERRINQMRNDAIAPLQDC